MDAQRKEYAKKLARLQKNTPIIMEKRGEEMMKEVKFCKTDLSHIGCTNWQNYDPIKPFHRSSRVDPKELEKDVVFHLGLVHATTIPFAVPYPELCFEVGQRCEIEERVL